MYMGLYTYTDRVIMQYVTQRKRISPSQTFDFELKCLEIISKIEQQCIASLNNNN